MLSKEAFYEKYLRNSDEKFPYMLLYRMKSDCDYAIFTSCNRHLWVSNNPEEHIAYMRYLYDFIQEKPKWLTAEQIDEYEQKLLGKMS